MVSLKTYTFFVLTDWERFEIPIAFNDFLISTLNSPYPDMIVLWNDFSFLYKNSFNFIMNDFNDLVLK